MTKGKEIRSLIGIAREQLLQDSPKEKILSTLETLSEVADPFAAELDEYLKEKESPQEELENKAEDETEKDPTPGVEELELDEQESLQDHSEEELRKETRDSKQEIIDEKEEAYKEAVESNLKEVLAEVSNEAKRRNQDHITAQINQILEQL